MAEAKRRYSDGRQPPPEVINSASPVTQNLSREVADGQHKLIALAAARGNSSAVNPLVPLGVCGFRAAAVYLNAAVLHCLSMGLLHHHSAECVKFVDADADDSAEFGDTPQLAEQEGDATTPLSSLGASTHKLEP
ncbi:hypothetical protein DVH24_032943 [Malus domestica]|uniref:Uncharacterized protein n=1 Tax=Malus domestica TaxID=3750 RepID=A0A498INC3_MALDO|nr:hypothetical protein DVH24_032943 [Malus domestica]